MLFEAYLLFSVCKYILSFSFTFCSVDYFLGASLQKKKNFDTGKADQANASSDLRKKK